MRITSSGYPLLLLLNGFSVATAPVAFHSQSSFKTDSNRPAEIVQSLRKASIIPDVLPESFVPSFELNVAYTSPLEKVTLGNTIPVKSTSSRPMFQVLPFNVVSSPSMPVLGENKTYTLVLTDPEATSKVKVISVSSAARYTNIFPGIITGMKLHESEETKGSASLDGGAYTLELRAEHPARGKNAPDPLDELVKYKAPAPPKKTGEHRYIFVLLEPKEGDGNSLKKPAKRPHWGYKKSNAGVMEWAEDNGLQPIGANFFLARHDNQ